MLQTNLSTRPFYNVRAVRILLAAALGVLLAVSAGHLLWAGRLAERERTLSARATQAKAEASQLRDKARLMQAQVDPREIEAMSAAAREVNAVIDQRAFSWSRLFVQLERSLPPNVRVTAIQPTSEEEGLIVSLHLQSRSEEDLSTFMDTLERQGAFTNIWPVERHFGEETVDAVVRGTFVPPVPNDASAASVEASVNNRGKGAR